MLGAPHMVDEPRTAPESRRAPAPQRAPRNHAGAARRGASTLRRGRGSAARPPCPWTWYARPLDPRIVDHASIVIPRRQVVTAAMRLPGAHGAARTPGTLASIHRDELRVVARSAARLPCLQRWHGCASGSKTPRQVCALHTVARGATRDLLPPRCAG